MKIVIINGSARKNGATASILRLIENDVKERGAQVMYYDLCDQNISPCLGCCACYRLGHCVINDNADKISAQIESADGIVIGSSTFASNVTGILKTFIDRGHFVIEQLLHSKYALCVTTYENYGGKDALKVIKSLVTLSGAYLTGAYSYKTPFNSKVTSNTDFRRKINRLSLKLFKSIRKKENYFFQRMKQKLVINVGLKRFVLNKGANYAAVQKRWSQLKLISPQ